MATHTFHAARLAGVACVPPAKSEAHRALLLAALGRGPCRLTGFTFPLCDDTQAMVNGVTALGATVMQEENALLVTPASCVSAPAEPAECDVHACAAALRMLIPAFLLFGRPVRFAMDTGLFNRPLDAFNPLMPRLGAKLTRTPAENGRRATVELSGAMSAGEYEIDGSLSSQFASGMLIALAHARGLDGAPAPATLLVKPPIVSRPYLDMTLAQMRRFGLAVEERGSGLFALSPAESAGPDTVAVAPDWSQAAVLLCVNAMGGGVILSGMRAPKDGDGTLQGDAKIVPLLQRMGLRIRGLRDGMMACCPSRAGLSPLRVDCDDIPDLAPILALTCTQAAGESVLSGVSRLRAKECDRLAATQELLTRLGANAEIAGDGDVLRVHGPARLTGGFTADARGDHRMVMLLAAAALLCGEPVTVQGVESVNKSWPGFLTTYRALGGQVT
jgi:3-phosphoshikimate 1-carboxyvinyltransferase